MAPAAASRGRRSAPTLTLAFHGRTLGTAIEPGRGCAGEVAELPIGLPLALAGPERALRMEPADLALVPQRSPTGSKYDAGGVLVVGGSPGMSGAPALAALAAFRAGAGVVWVCVPASEHAAVAAHAPELMVHGELAPERVLELAARARAVVLGPGLGRSPEAASWSTRSCRASRPRSCSTPTPSTRWPGGSRRSPGAPGPTALTPHAGELARLLGRESAEIAAARLASVAEAAERSRRSRPAEGPRHARRGARRASPRRRDGGAVGLLHVPGRLSRLTERAHRPVEQPAQEVVEVVLAGERVVVVDVVGVEVLADVEHRAEHQAQSVDRLHEGDHRLLVDDVGRSATRR